MGEREYDGDETGIDLSWQSDLKDVASKVTNPPAPDRSGETIGGTTADDFHDARTTLVPERLEQESLTALQLDIIRTAVIHTDATAREIAAAVDASRPWVVKTLATFLPEHPAAEHSPTALHPDQTRIDEFYPPNDH